MRHTSTIITLAMLSIIGAVAAVQAQDAMQSTMTMNHGKPLVVTGTLIDTKCYSLDHRNTAVDHVTPHGEMKGCAGICANLGIPVAVLTSKGVVWTLVTPSKDLADHMGKIARVTGSRVFGGHEIRPERIEVKDPSGAWSEVKITMPMPM